MLLKKRYILFSSWNSWKKRHPCFDSFEFQFYYEFITLLRPLKYGFKKSYNIYDLFQCFVLWMTHVKKEYISGYQYTIEDLKKILKQTVRWYEKNKCEYYIFSTCKINKMYKI